MQVPGAQAFAAHTSALLATPVWEGGGLTQAIRRAPRFCSLRSLLAVTLCPGSVSEVVARGSPRQIFCLSTWPVSITAGSLLALSVPVVAQAWHPRVAMALVDKNTYAADGEGRPPGRVPLPARPLVALQLMAKAGPPAASRSRLDP